MAIEFRAHNLNWSRAQRSHHLAGSEDGGL